MRLFAGALFWSLMGNSAGKFMLAAPTCMHAVVRHLIPGVGAPERRWQRTPLRMVRETRTIHRLVDK